MTSPAYGAYSDPFIIATQVTVNGHVPYERSLNAHEIDARKKIGAALLDADLPEFNDTLPDQTLALDHVDQVDAVILRALGRREQAAVQQYGDARTNVWQYLRNNKSVAAVLMPKKFFGRLVQPRIVTLPIDDEFVVKFSGKNDFAGFVEDGILSRMGVMADMHSTGKGIQGTSFLDVVAYSRSLSSNEDRRHGIIFNGTATGNRIAEYATAESVANARIAEAYELSRTLSAGAPGLGKRR